MFNPSLPAWRWLTLTLATVLLIVWGSSCTAQLSEEIPIGVIVPLTGDVSLTSGRPTLEGIELAVEQVNEAGGLTLNGRAHPIALQVADSRDNPEQAVIEAKQLIEQGEVVALVGLPLSREAIPVAEVAEAAAIPMVSSKSTNPETTANKAYIFRATFTDTFQGEVIATLLHDELKVQRAAVLYDEASNYNRFLAEVFREAFTAMGGEITAFETYTTGDRQFTSQLNTIQASNPEALFLPNYPAEVIEQAQQAQELGLDAVLIGGDAWTGFTDVSAPALDGALYTADWATDIETAASQAFMAAYQVRFQRTPTSAAALGYDAVQLIFNAIAQQQSFTPDAIREGLAQTENYPGVTGEISFGDGGDPVKGVTIVRVEQGQAKFDRVVKPARAS